MASPNAAASSADSSTTSRPPPSSGTRITMPRPSLVTSSGPSPVRGFIAAILPSPSSRSRAGARHGTAPPRGTAPSGTPHAALPGSLGEPPQPQSFLSVALLSRVPQQNGNDRPCSLPSGGAHRPFYRPFGAGRSAIAPARRVIGCAGGLVAPPRGHGEGVGLGG